MDKATTQILGAVRHLELINSVPVNITDNIVSIFNTYSVAAFMDIFKIITNNIIINDKEYTPEQVCHIVEKQYWHLKDARKWDRIPLPVMLSNDKKKTDPDTSDMTPKKDRSPKYQHPAAGCPDWRVCCRKVLYWCNMCSTWKTTHFTKTTEGVN
eukprot:15341412-Ditylum_brightwellii.AAC.1